MGGRGEGGGEGGNSLVSIKREQNWMPNRYQRFVAHVTAWKGLPVANIGMDSIQVSSLRTDNFDVQSGSGLTLREASLKHEL